MDRESYGVTVSPLPPPPPQNQQRSTSIRDILDDYYEGGSFSSGKNGTRAMNIADSVLAEMDKISPSKEESDEHSKGSEMDERNNDLPDMGDVKNLEMMIGNVSLEREDFFKTGSTCIEADVPPTKALQMQSYPSHHLARQCNTDMRLTSNDGEVRTDYKEDLHKTKRQTACVAIGKNNHDVQQGNKTPLEQPEIRIEKAITGSPPIHNDSTNIKKPFLRKGARKEPSSLHRFSIAENKKQVPKTVPGEGGRGKNLEHLEQMQEKQIEDLQKRIHRRQQAREDMQSKTRGCKIEVMEQKRESKCDENLDKKQECHQPSPSSSSSASDGESVCSDYSSDGFDGDSDDSSKAKKTQEPRTKSRKRNQHLKLPQTGQRMVKSANMQSPFKPTTTVKNNNRPSSAKDFQTPEMKEQWQLIKSMRRRQEAALRAVEKEREETKAWAASEKDKVNKWKDQQRSLIQKEKQRAMNSSMVSQRKQRRGRLEEQAAEAAQFSQRRAREEIDSLKESLSKQKIEADATKSRHRLSEKRWKDMVSERDKRIQELREEVACISEKKEKVKQETSELKSKIEELMMERRNRKKKSKSLSKKNEVEIVDKVDAAAGEELSAPPVRCVEDGSRRITANHVHDYTHSNCGAPEMEQVTQQPDDPVSHKREGGGIEELDKNVAKILSSNQDLIENPTEDWLQRHLNGIGDAQHEDSTEPKIGYQRTARGGTTPNSVYFTPLKERPYDPLKYTDMDKINERKASSQANVPSTGKMSKCHEHRNANGTRVVTYQNGTVKETLPDGTAIVRFANGDIKTSYGNVGITVYYYSESKVSCMVYFKILFSFECSCIIHFVLKQWQTSHTKHPDGTEVFEFASGQSEKHLPDGSKEVQFPDGSRKVFFANGGSETLYRDGVNVLEEKAGHTRILNF